MSQTAQGKSDNTSTAVSMPTSQTAPAAKQPDVAEPSSEASPVKEATPVNAEAGLGKGQALAHLKVLLPGFMGVRVRPTKEPDINGFRNCSCVEGNNSSEVSLVQCQNV